MTSILHPDTIALAPWSVTKAKTAYNCPQQFLWQYVEKKKGLEKPVDRRQRVGIAVHEILERVLQNPRRDLAGELVGATTKHDLTSAEVDEVRSFFPAVRGFLDRMEKFTAKSLAPKHKPFIEAKLAITPDFQPTKFFGPRGQPNDILIRGVVDLGIPTRSGTLVVLDHKSRADGRLDWYMDQLHAYKVLGYYGFRHVFPEITAVQEAIHYVLSGQVVWTELFSRSKIENVYRRWLIEFLNGAVVRGQKGGTTPGRYCDWCKYTQICPAQQERADGSKSKGQKTTEINI